VCHWWDNSNESGAVFAGAFILLFNNNRLPGAANLVPELGADIAKFSDDAARNVN